MCEFLILISRLLYNYAKRLKSGDRMRVQLFDAEKEKDAPNEVEEKPQKWVTHRVIDAKYTVFKTFPAYFFLRRPSDWLYADHLLQWG